MTSPYSYTVTEQLEKKVHWWEGEAGWRERR